MYESKDETAPDFRPALVICAWDVDEAGWDPVENLSGESWNPVGARTLPVAAGEPEALAAVLSAHLDDRSCRGLLLVGRTRRSDAFLVQIRAENRSLDGRRHDIVGPGTARATAPVADIVRALNEAGLAADASSDSEEDAGSYLLYRVLSGLPDGRDTPAIGLLRAPEHETDVAFQRAVKAAAQAMAHHLPPLPRSRAN
jgi:pyrrolidone-carboxylate peptidase